MPSNRDYKQFPASSCVSAASAIQVLQHLDLTGTLSSTIKKKKPLPLTASDCTEGKPPTKGTHRGHKATSTDAAFPSKMGRGKLAFRIQQWESILDLLLQICF